MKNPNLKDQWTEYGRTETITDSKDPKWTKFFKVAYHFEESQPCLFQVVDSNTKNTVGNLITKLAEIVSSKGGLISHQLVDEYQKKAGFIQIRSEEVQDSKEKISLQFSACGIPKQSFFGKADPFFAISRLNEDDSWTVVYTSEVIKSSLSPLWKLFSIQSQHLCNSDSQRPLRIEVFSHENKGKHNSLGISNTNLEKLKQGATMNIINPEMKIKKNYVNSGVLTVLKMSKITESTFLDFIRGGLQISLMVAIDFTASNGDIDLSNSLHHVKQGTLNDYQEAILAVGDILNYYDSDKKYPVFGFGAKLPTQGNQWKLSHCFPCTMDPNNTDVYGVKGILDVYNFAVTRIRFSGPTVLKHVISTAAKYAKTDKDTHYYILLILTDGEIGDMDDTIHEIVQASNLPLSIIIVGIGDESFDKMQVLDADDTPLVSEGIRMKRDIVQFVPFKKFKTVNKDRLAEEVLEEVPRQVIEYMNEHGIKPKVLKKTESFQYFSAPQQDQTYSTGNQVQSPTELINISFSSLHDTVQPSKSVRLNNPK